MDLSITLGVEIGIAVLLALALFWAKPEYGLFFYGLALGFPDIALALGTAINLRLDDGLIVLFLLRSLLCPPAGDETIKMIGCVTILIALPRLLLLQRRLRFLAAGLMCGGVALMFQIGQRLESNPKNFLGGSSN